MKTDADRFAQSEDRVEMEVGFGDTSNVRAHTYIHFIVPLGRQYALEVDGREVANGIMATNPAGHQRTSDGKHAILTWDGARIGSYKGAVGHYLNHCRACDCSHCQGPLESCHG
jgi:hypothetical protein